MFLLCATGLLSWWGLVSRRGLWVGPPGGRLIKVLHWWLKGREMSSRLSLGRSLVSWPRRVPWVPYRCNWTWVAGSFKWPSVLPALHRYRSWCWVQLASGAGVGGAAGTHFRRVVTRMVWLGVEAALSVRGAASRGTESLSKVTVW